MVYSYGGRVDNDSNAITVIDEENKTAVTTGYVNGEYVEFGGGGGGGDFSTAEVTFTSTLGEYSVFGYTITSEAPLTIAFPLLDLQKDNMSAYFITSNMFNNLASEPVLTGGIQFIDSLVIISGDGTFTANGTIPE